MFVPSEMHDAFAVTITFGHYARETIPITWPISVARIPGARGIGKPGSTESGPRSRAVSSAARTDSATQRVPISRVLFLGCPGRLAGSAVGRHGAS
jgi:hypothetical protein